MSDAMKDAIAEMAMGDLLGQGAAKETYEKTGRVDISTVIEKGEERRRVILADESTSFRVVKPLDPAALTKAVSESMIVKSLTEDDSWKEKAAAADIVANEAKVEASQEISKILKALR